MGRVSGVTIDIRPLLDPGEAVDPLSRLTDPAYADGVSEPRDGPNAAQIARIVSTQGNVDMPHPLGLSEMWVTWGQFLDHDIDLTPEGEDEVIDEAGLFAPVRRSIFDEDGDPDAPREQVNVITPLIDASNIYGSDSGRLAALRSFESGRLSTSPGLDGTDHLMLNTPRLPNGGDTDPQAPLFLAGDVRANENVALTALHTAMVNEHNYWAGRLTERYPEWDDEAVFQGARALVETVNQQITYEEFLPLLIGEDALPALSDSADGIDTRISTEFSTAAYRFGHSMVAPMQTPVDERGRSGPEDLLPVREAFFNNDPIHETGIAGILRGISAMDAQQLDAKVIDDLNVFLFTEDGMSGFSLPAINILRGRDHGIDTYVNVRAALLGDIDPATLNPYDFSIITSDFVLQKQLMFAYGTVHQVDLWVGGIAEDHVPGATLGPLFQEIVADQFTRLRDGDPFWHERRAWLDEDLHEEAAASTLADVLMRSGGIGHIQRDVFLASERQGGTDRSDFLRGNAGRDLLIGFDGHDRLMGGRGDDDLFGGRHSDRLYGQQGNDALHGGNGFDYLFGGRGDDILSGGHGRDWLFGGAGRDRFVFHEDERYHDVVNGFRSGIDTFELRGFQAEFEDLDFGKWGARITVSIDGDMLFEVRNCFGTLAEDDFLFIG